MATPPPRLVVHVVHSFSIGGLENGVVNLVNRLPRHRWRHAILALTDISAEFSRRIEHADVEYLALRKGPGHLASLYPRIFRIFRRWRPAIVHSRNLAALEAQVPAWLAGVPVRIHGEHGWDVGDPAGTSNRYRLVRRAYRPFVQRYVALSRHIESYLEHGVGIAAASISRICNGVDVQRFGSAAGGREPIQDCPFRDPALWLVGTVGRMQAVKDPMTLAAAFLQAIRSDPDARARMRLILVGGGPLKERVMRLLEDGGVGHLAWLPGDRADVPQIMRGLDCFVLPSLSEGISNTILEAMATGLPVVATDVGGNAELVEGGVTGRLVPAADSGALMDAILAYFGAPALAREHGRLGRSRAEREFSLDRMVADYERIYLELADPRARAGAPLTAA